MGSFYPLKIEPVIKEYIWGRESWCVSTHPGGLCSISNGSLAGQTLREAVGELPVLIKHIEAKEPLSIQVHPNDEHAWRVEKKPGKNEMWYITKAEPGAKLVLGFKEEFSKNELKEFIDRGKILEAVRYVPVKAGDCYCVPAGMVHSIGGGISLIEVQQPSDVTYRLFDFDRADAQGNPRELHIDKALDVIDTGAAVIKASSNILTDWEYFRCELANDALIVQAAGSPYECIVGINEHGDGSRVTQMNKA